MTRFRRPHSSDCNRWTHRHEDQFPAVSGDLNRFPKSAVERVPPHHQRLIKREKIPTMLIKMLRPMTGNWEQDEATVREIAETPTSAAKFALHAQVILTLFNHRTHGTRFAPTLPGRSGLLRKVHDELYPIAHFARLHFAAAEEVVIAWRDGDQNFDATIEDRREGPNQSHLQYLEVTTLQDRDDADLLKQLSKSERGVVNFEGDFEQAVHDRKVALLRTALGTKGEKNYRPGTALLVYTDENRFRQFSFGVPGHFIDKKASFSAVLAEMAPLLGVFAEVHVYSSDIVYGTIRPTPRPAEHDSRDA